MGMCMSVDGEETREQKRLVKEMLAAEAKAAQLLSEMPGRLCSNGATKTCSLHTRQGCKGINQDSMLAWEGFSAAERSVFLGVFDGHGPNGHTVANKVRDCLPSLLTLPLESLLVEGYDGTHHHIHKPIKIINSNEPRTSDQDDGDDDEHKGENIDYDEDNADSVWIEEKFTAAFQKMDECLKMHPKVSCMSSGTTAVALLVQGKDLVVGSVGDSRAILATQSLDGSLVAHQLTVDLKPNSPGEIERIQKCQGRVFALDDEPHISRLWLPHQNMPGLAMSRAFGDFCLKEYGLIATPQISHRKLTNEDEFIVLATDGVWDVLTNADVIGAVLSSPSKEEAAKCITDAAANAWKIKNWASKMDDCAVVCHFLKDNPSLPSASKLRAKESSQEEDNTKHEDSTSQRPPKMDKQLARYETFATSPSDLPETKSSSPPSTHQERGA